ncbi:hypothetical protein ACFPM3_19140 [Streptomyces coeruleoprunus]|uniref:Uncharacterized protein n=1 Tax=Streptomyces coeruleoprunus TaxID=285563 RepID=A0ABV9XIW1_9ACTN
MLRRISIALAGLLAVGLFAAAPASADGGHKKDVHGCWGAGGHVAAGDVHVAGGEGYCWHVG